MRPRRGLRRRLVRGYIDTVKHLRGLTAFALAVVIAVSPAISCADFCPDAAAIEAEIIAASAGAPAPSMPADCYELMGGSADSKPDAHDPNCDGCADCPAVASVKSPSLAAASALGVDAPTVIAEIIVAPVADFYWPALHRMTPPAHGPPVIATPVILKDILRL